MFGVDDAVITAVGTRSVAKAATVAVKALARKFTFRWRVSRRVHKRTELACHWGTYRKWLKTITSEELATPVEISGPSLATRLDLDLSAASDKWASQDDHSSLAIRLVKATFPAIAALSGEADRAELTEIWAQKRSSKEIEQLRRLEGSRLSLSPHDLEATLDLESKARREVRLQVFEVTESPLTPYFDRISIPDVPAGKVRVLLGDFGSGKSETAEAWHRATIKQFTENDDAPFPVWLSARELNNQTLDGALERQFGPTWHQIRGASIAVDGLDEADPATAEALLENARTLARRHENVRILMTSRPGILSPNSEEELKQELLSKDEALALVEAAGGHSRDAWQWSADMRASVSRPIFALAAGSMLGLDQPPRGEADLIRGLVERALEKGTERSAITSHDTFSALKKLAVALTGASGDGLTFSERQVARSSRLVADAPDRSVVFSLPIFQHWFAAQAILDKEVRARTVVDSPVNFNRWRWAAAVAALSARGSESLDELVGSWVAGNAGAAAWILKEAFGGHREWRTEGNEDLDAKTSGDRLLRALRTWSDALGPLSEGVLPAPLVEGKVGLGVALSGRSLSLGFSKFHTEYDQVTEVEPNVHPFLTFRDSEWIPWRIIGSVPEDDAWPWRLVQKMIAKATLNKLANDPFLGARDGVWSHERRFDLARRLLGYGSLFHAPLSADAVRARAAEEFDAIRRDRNRQISFQGSLTCSGAELQDLIDWIDMSEVDKLTTGLPQQDVPYPTSGWVWDSYSPERLMELEVEVYEGACKAYDEAMDNAFAGLQWSMPSTALAPFGVVMEISFSDNTPRLSVIRVPMALMSEFAPSEAEAVWSPSRRVVVTQTRSEHGKDWERFSAVAQRIHSWLSEQDREAIGAVNWSVTGADGYSTVRPKSSIAANWLWSDLQSVGLGSGIFVGFG